jgi:hypothetical protein
METMYELMLHPHTVSVYHYVSWYGTVCAVRVRKILFVKYRMLLQGVSFLSAVLHFVL